MSIYNLSYKNKNILITGGTSGIGKAIAESFRNCGLNVVAIYANNKEKAEKFQNLTGIKTIQCDASNFIDCQAAIQKAEEHFSDSITTLINSAGITQDRMFHRQTEEIWTSVITTNLLSTINMSHCTISKMRDAQSGRIINISSVNANGALGQTNYSASKAGIEGFTKSLALENARLGITVNAIAPGYIDTDMTKKIPPHELEKIISKIPMGRLGKTEEIASLAMFLASDQASFITGAVIHANGGLRT